jgi:hypothetical protein
MISDIDKDIHSLACAPENSAVDFVQWALTIF